MRHIKNCKPGDIICDRGGNKAKILGRVGTLIFRSEWYRYDIPAQHFVTEWEATDMDWKILTSDGRLPMKRKELEDQMLIKVID